MSRLFQMVHTALQSELGFGVRASQSFTSGPKGSLDND